MHINNLSNSPIHEQIELDIKKQIAKGVLKSGDRVLSVRELATTLKINPNTVTRAYKQLEKDGYIILLPGKGIFIKNVTDAFPTMMKEKELQQQLELTLLEMHYHNISQDTIDTWYKDFFERIGK
ncbi:MAG: GntR family transcriptional regulator [Vagococcus sp.]|jgi:GntR family transcriptional regulator|nr:GntR family transcriptional regulator [Vagococcus sp.]